jgi:16S rRNA (adenine1518-N6/adenine1519-N6)-dimethyltransferase
MDQIPTDKSLGQHWLSDDVVLADIVAAADMTADDTVLEIGPGPGTLTKHLVASAGQVVAVEFDQKLASELPTRVKADNLRVVQSDILWFDLTKLPPDYVVVANIPYYLTSKLVRVLSESSNQAKTVVLLVQKEVAERLAAPAGQMSLLSVSAQFYWQVELDSVVPAALFTPPPKVDSQVVVMHRIDGGKFSVDQPTFFRLVKAGFSARRKTLQNSLSGGLRISREAAGELLEAADLSPTARPQELSLDDWYRLYQAHAANEN